MSKMKDSEIKNLSTTRKDFYRDLEKACKPVDKPKTSRPAPKQSQT